MSRCAPDAPAAVGREESVVMLEAVLSASAAPSASQQRTAIANSERIVHLSIPVSRMCQHVFLR